MHTVYSLGFSSDGRAIASGDAEGNVRLWDLDNQSNQSSVLILTIGNGGVTDIAISPDCSLVAAGSTDMTIHVWDIHTRTQIEHLKSPDGHMEYIHSITFSSDNKKLISRSLDGITKIWELSLCRQGEIEKVRCSQTFEGFGVSHYLLKVYNDSQLY